MAFDFFTVPTVTFKLLYCFFVIEHGHRKILHFKVTRYPTAEWVIPQPREAFPEAGPCRYVNFDRDRKFDAELDFIQSCCVAGHLTEAGELSTRDFHYLFFGTGGEEIHRMPELLSDHCNRIRECGLHLGIPGGLAHRELSATCQLVSQQRDD